jgi:putative membrane protein
MFSRLLRLRSPATGLPVPVAPRLPVRLGWVAIALACLAGGAIALAALPLDPLARHMAAHILTMNLVAPLLALAVVMETPVGPHRFPWSRPGNLTIATIGQLVLLWSLHAPPVWEAIGHTTPGVLLLHASLTAIALWFWLAVCSDRSAFRWRALTALALTGKLFCLLGVLLVFAPRTLYGAHAGMPGLAPASDRLADQQLAGLMMVIACPLSYVLAGVVIAAKGLRDISVSDPAARTGEQTAPTR